MRARKRPLLYDKAADAHYDFISAFIKSMRGSDPDASVYYLAAMLESGEDARFIARRMIVLASEDIGNADPRALLVAVAAAQAVEHVGLPEARLNLSQAAIYLARAPKSNASYEAIKRATKDVQERGNIRPPKALADGSYYGRKLGKGQGYIYPHSDPAGFDVDYLPDELKGTTYYEPSGSGEESEGLVGPAADPLRRKLAERAAELLPGLRGPLDVVLDAAKLELAVVATQRVRRAHVSVERHADAARVDERRSVRARPAELQVAVAEDDRLVADAVQHPLVVVAGLGRKALDVRQRRAVDVEDAVQLGLRLERVEPALVRAEAGVVLVRAPPSPRAGRAAARAASARRCHGSRSCSAARAGARSSPAATATTTPKSPPRR